MKIGELYDLDVIRAVGGIVDYVVGTPLTKVYVAADNFGPEAASLPQPVQARGGAALLLLPSRPTWCIFEVPNAIACVSFSGTLFRAPIRAPSWRSALVAKRELRQGETLDGYGGYTSYGEAVAVDEMSSNRYLPEGLVEGCVLRRNVDKTKCSPTTMSSSSRQARPPASRRAVSALPPGGLAVRPPQHGAGRMKVRHLLRWPRRPMGSEPSRSLSR